MAADVAVRIAAALLAVNGLGFGIPCVVGIQSLAAGHGIAQVMGFPAYGEGPFERHGIRSTVPLLAAFLVVCLLEVVAAVLLWKGHISGALLSMALLVPGAVFWWGFALPFPPVFAVVRTGLLLWHWDRLV